MVSEFQCEHFGSSVVSKFFNVGRHIKCKICNNISVIPDSAGGH